MWLLIEVNAMASLNNIDLNDNVGNAELANDDVNGSIVRP
jgi:hypothetical protein